MAGSRPITRIARSPDDQTQRRIHGDHAEGVRRDLTIATAVAAVLLAFASGYGYHRDELYFLEAGHHLAWAYAARGLSRR